MMREGSGGMKSLHWGLLPWGFCVVSDTGSAQFTRFEGGQHSPCGG